MPVFEINQEKVPDCPPLYAVTKDSLPNKSMPICFSQFDAEVIQSMPEYMRQGLRRAKLCKLKCFTNNSPLESHYIDSYVLQSVLLSILFKRRYANFKKRL